MLEYFTISTANSALPDVIKKYRHLRTCRDGVMQAQQELEAAMANAGSLRDYAVLKQELNSRLVTMYRSIQELEQTGVVIKSIDEGLLDFPAKRFDQEIWLCWKDGETEIKFWHEKDVGFMGRKPIEVSDESLV